MKIFVLDDDHHRHARFKRELGHHEVYIAVHTYHEAIEELKKQRFDLVYLDRDLNEFGKRSVIKGMYAVYEMTGEEVVKFICEDLDKAMWPGEVIVHSWNSGGAPRMVARLATNGIKASWQLFNGGKNYDHSGESRPGVEKMNLHVPSDKWDGEYE